MRYVEFFYWWLIGFMFFSWVYNIIQFFGCDFDPIGKEEVLKGLGMFIAPLSMITAWI
jgi:hypothetical protein